MQDILITILRDKKSSRTAYRAAVDQLATLLALQAASSIPQEKVTVETPVGKAEGKKFAHPVILVPVLRSGLALLPSFLRCFPEASIGFIGMRRDEVTMEPHNYYINLPPITPTSRIIVLEPMIATGGSGVVTLEILCKAGASPENILFVSVVAAPEGIDQIKKQHPFVKLLIAAVDQQLNASKYIVPGLGDFGDRYCGTDALP